MRGLVLRVEDNGSEFLAQLGIGDSDGLIHRRVACDVGGVMRKCAKCKRILVGILAFAEKFEDKVAAADVVDEITEFLAAERIVPRSWITAPP